MKKTIITYGLIAGAIIASVTALSLAFDASSEHLAGLEWLGYAVMIIAFSMIFVAIKGYRDKELGGVIRFGTAFGVGIGVTLVASVIYVVAWEINLAITDYAFMEDYTQSLIAAEAADGASDAELAALQADMDVMKERYSNPLFRVPITLLEIFPVGLLITLLSAAVLRNSKVLPA
ncbi:MAG: DUF4199 domain-containing protein [Woeseiaceae bacterium]|nr:DUF4199 domain-containing protein [Woeseiaceae bacterium]